MNIGIYTGSFDPITLGHFDIIERASKHVKRLYIAVVDNPQKKHLFSAEERESLVKASTKHLKNVSVVRCASLVADLVKELDADVLVRGIRSAEDADHELCMAAMNRDKCGIDTLFLSATPRYAHIRSRFVRDFLIQGEVPKEFVPAAAVRALKGFLARK